MPAIISLLFSRAGIVGMIGASLLLLFGIQEVRLKAAQHGEAQAKATLKAAVSAEASREKAAAQISADAKVGLAQDRTRIRTVTKVLIQKVPTYVTAADDARVLVPLGFVRLHDAAAQGVPAPASGPDETPSGVPLSAVAETVVANYGAAWECRAEAAAWRDWYMKQAATWNR
jgi:plasmid stability protein